MTRSTGNRLGVGLLGLALLAAGAAPLLTASGLVPSAYQLAEPSSTWEQLTSFAGDQPTLAVAAVLAAGIVLALLGCWLLVAELRPGRRWRRRRADLVIPAEGRASTTVDGRALSGAVADDLLTDPGIVDAEVVTWEDEDHTLMDVVLGLARGVGIDEVRGSVDAALDHAEEALGRGPLRVHVRVDVRHDAGAGGRVR